MKIFEKKSMKFVDVSTFLGYLVFLSLLLFFLLCFISRSFIHKRSNLSINLCSSVNNRDVTVRTCQTAKTETIDPCKAIEGKVTNNIHDLQSCQLCEQDACNGSISVSPRILLPLLSIIGAIAFASFYKTA